MIKKPDPTGTQYSRNICCVLLLPQPCDVPGLQWTFREHFKGKYFLKNFLWKSCFLLEVYDITITNVNLLANSSNDKSMFPEYSKNIPRISVSKIFQRYPRNIVRFWKYFYEFKKFKKIFCVLFCGTFNIGSLFVWNVFLNFIETVFHLESCLEKVRIDACQLEKNKISTTLLSTHVLWLL